jgi:dTDP-4-dehydrorhamnose reductase
MIFLLGSTGYMGQAFAEALQKSQTPFLSLSRKEMDYSRFEVLLEAIQKHRATFVLNAAGFTGKPNVDACETAWADTLQGNTLLPLTIAQACAAAKIPWGHVSSGCIFAGAKVFLNGEWRVEKDLSKPALKKLAEETPSAIRGFDEGDEPNFSFRRPPCSFYSGTKALAEESIRNVGQGYVWRLRIPFDEVDSARNYLTKLQRYSKVYDNVNSLSHRADFVRACLELWQRKAPFGTYNVTNPGFVTSRQVIQMIERIQKPARKFEFWENDEEFYRTAARTPRSNCVMEVSKLLSTGIKMRTVGEALEESLRNWKPEFK